MTISKYLSDFINLYKTITIETNHVQDGSDKYGLFKSPSRTIDRRIDGSINVTETYQFFASQASMAESERKEDDEWLEDFVYWIDDYPSLYDYPEIDGERKITDIQANGCPYPYADGDRGITYQISIQITYEREVE